MRRAEAVRGRARAGGAPGGLPSTRSGRGPGGRRSGVVLRARLAACAVLALLLPAAARLAHGADRYDPALRFQSIRTEHFVIHYHQGEEPGALRLARVAEGVHAELAARYRHSPRGRTHVVLVDQTDLPNGWATPVPYNLIEITAAPPTGASFIGNTDDWLRLVFTHEYVHVLHLDQSRGWAAVARAVFGRTPVAFPNLTLPLWQIEGLATYEESRGGQGRVPAGDFHAVVAQAARERRFDSIDRAGGGLVDWPGGTAPYAYGAYFHDFLARRYGDERFTELGRRTAGRAPYLTAGAFKTVYGSSLGELWRAFAADEAHRARGAAATHRGLRRLTTHGFGVSGPRYERDGSIVYSVQTPHAFPALVRLPPAGAPQRLATRYGGRQVSVAGDAIYFDQLELVRSVALQGDLYRLDRASGNVRRVTTGARLADPDLSPDGRRVAVVEVAAERRHLLIVERATLERAGVLQSAVRIGGADDIFATPRWSPDGRRLAAERRVREGASEIVLVDPDSGRVTPLASASGARHITPAWTADGSALLFAADRGGTSFNLYRAVLDERRTAIATLEQLTALPGGARDPDVSADGSTVVFVGYTADGYDLFSMPLTPVPPLGVRGAPAVQDARAREREAGARGHHGVTPPDGAMAARPDAPTTGAGAPLPAAMAPARQPRPSAYSPWPTLLPRAWLPLVEIDDSQLRVGASTGGIDALGYHAWAAAISWAVARDAELVPVSPGARPNVALSYQYDRWRPTFVTALTDETSPLILRTEAGERRPIAIREQAVDLGVALPFRQVRATQTVLGLWRLERTTVSSSGTDGRAERGALRLGWSATTARRYGYSISREDGIAAGVSSELARPAFGGDGRATFTHADIRGYLPLGPRHATLAVRASGSVSRGDEGVRRTPRLGGASGDRAVLSFDEEASSLLRGFPANSFLGAHVALANAEYRVPLAYVERGAGTWPIFLRAVHATAFVDAGHAWSGRFRGGDIKTSWGAEIGADVVAGFALPFTLSAGIGWGRDGARTLPDSREVYIRLGRGFE